MITPEGHMMMFPNNRLALNGVVLSRCSLCAILGMLCSLLVFCQSPTVGTRPPVRIKNSHYRDIEKSTIELFEKQGSQYGAISNSLLSSPFFSKCGYGELAGRIPTLQVLQLDSNLLAKIEVPFGLDLTRINYIKEDPSSFSQSPWLISLRLAHHPLSSRWKHHIERVSNLQSISIVNCDLGDNGLVFLALCRQLQAIEVGFHHLTPRDAEVLQALPQLSEVSFSHCHIPDHVAKRLSGMPVHTILIDDSTVSSTLLEVIVQLKQLRAISIHGNCKPPADCFSRLCQLDSLSHLALTSCDLQWHSHSAGRLPVMLQTLDLSFSAIGDNFINGIHKLERLHSLILDGTRVTDMTLNSLSLPSLRLLSLVDCDISSQAIHAFKRTHPLCVVIDPVGQRE
jgi:hypothetical protein